MAKSTVNNEMRRSRRQQLRKSACHVRPAPTCADLVGIVEEFLGMDYMLWPDGGYHSGSADTPVRGVLITWMANVAALTEAVRQSCNIVVCHEAPLFAEKREMPPYRWLTPNVGPLEPSRHPNSRRRRLIEKHGLTVFVCHYGLDRFGHEKAFADAVGLTRKYCDHGWESVYELARPTTVAALADDIKRRLRIEGTIRVAGDLKKRVRRVGNFWGGLGLLSNVYWLRESILHGAEVGICGETDELMMHYAIDAGVPLIETSHQLSEEIGMRYYAGQVKHRFPDLRVVTFLQGRPYRTL